MEIGACSHRGKVREINEDAYYIPLDKSNLFIVADGMGGHNAGEVASNGAVKSIKEFMDRHIDQWIEQGEETVFEVLREAILEANKDIFDKANSEEAYKGMGTTLTVVLILSKVYIGHVGDSRAYLIQNNQMTQITKDHSLVAELIRNGSITEKEARTHPQRNVITRALGTAENLNIDLYTLGFSKDDIILLCTDGLSNFVEMDEIKDRFSNCEKVQQACEDLVALANERGGHDNITIVAIKNKP